MICQILSHYRIVEKIGAGGMGEVYKAHDERLDRDVAVKVLPSGTLADENARKRFRKEALALSKLNHPNIATVFDFDTELPQNSWLARARSNLQVMYRTALAVSHTLDIDQLLQRIMDLIFEWVEADRGCIMLIDVDTGRLEPKVRRMRRGKAGARQPGEDRISISKTILDYVLQHNEGVLTSDAQQDDRWDAAASILAGEMSATVAQNPYNMGALGVESVIKLLQGETLDPVIDTGTVLVTAENAAEFAE